MLGIVSTRSFSWYVSPAAPCTPLMFVYWYQPHSVVLYGNLAVHVPMPVEYSKSIWTVSLVGGVALLSTFTSPQ